MFDIIVMIILTGLYTYGFVYKIGQMWANYK